MTLRRAVLIISIFISFSTPFVSASVIIALPAIARHFTMNTLALNWVNNAFLLATAVFLLPFGRLADIFGRRRLLQAGMVLFLVSSTLIAISPSSAWLIACRVLQGLGSALIFSTAVALLTSVVEPKERGRVLGMNTAAVYVGLSLGPVVGGAVTRFFGWRILFLVPLPLVAVALVILRRYVRSEWAESAGETFDRGGSLIYVFSLVAVMVGISFLSIWKAPALVALIAGVSGMVLFFFFERGVTYPLLRIDRLRHNRVFAFSNLAALVNYSATFAVGIAVSMFLQYVKGFPPHKAGLVMLAQPLLQAVFSPFAGRLSDRIEARIVASIGMGLCTAGLAMLVFLSAGSSLIWLVFDLSLLGIGFAFFSSPNTNAIMSAVERKIYGVASSMLATMRMVGQTLSSALFTLITSIYLGQAHITSGNQSLFMKSFRTTFILFSILCLLGVFASMARGRHALATGAP